MSGKRCRKRWPNCGPRTENNKLEPEKIEAEFGDLLFSLINYARFIGVNPDNALERTNRKFIHRFNYLESEVNASGKKLQDADPFGNGFVLEQSEGRREMSGQ